MAPFPHWFKGLTPEMVRRAELELGETPEVKKMAVEELRQLIEGEENFSIPMDETFLIKFLRAKKYEVKRAFKCLKNYFSMKAQYPDVLNVLPSDIKHILEMDFVFITTKRGFDQEGVLVLLLGSADDKLLTSEDILSSAFVSADVAVEAEASQICGSSIIFDFKGVTWRKLVNLSTPRFLSLVAKGLQDAWPHRINGLHVVNAPSFFSYTYSLFRPMLSKKMRERVHFHGNNLESLHKYFPKEILPEQLGGAMGKKDFQEFRTQILEREKIAEKFNKFVYHGVKYSSAFSKSCERN